MQKYNLYAGLSGSFGGANYYLTKEFETEDEAEEKARDIAIEEYESYGGLHGLTSMEEISERFCEEKSIEEDELSEEGRESIMDKYIEEIESWIEYYAILTSEDSNNKGGI